MEKISYPCVETMTRVALRDAVVRVWSKTTLDADGGGVDRERARIRKAVHAIYKKNDDFKGTRLLGTIPGVSAYEVLGADGDGIVVYVDWP